MQSSSRIRGVRLWRSDKQTNYLSYNVTASVRLVGAGIVLECQPVYQARSRVPVWRRHRGRQSYHQRQRCLLLQHVLGTPGRCPSACAGRLDPCADPTARRTRHVHRRCEPKERTLGGLTRRLCSSSTTPWGTGRCLGLSVYRCLAAGIRQRTTACEPCSELRTRLNLSCPAPPGEHCWGGQIRWAPVSSNPSAGDSGVGGERVV